MPVTVQLEPLVIEPPLRLKVFEPFVAPVKVAPVQVVAPEPENVMPLGNVSATATPAIVTPLAAGLVIVIVIADVPFTAVLVGLNAFVIVGGARTTNVAEPVPPVPPCVELAAPVVFAREPDAVAVTVTPRAQLLLAAIEPPVRLTEPALAFAVKVPPQVLVAPGVE